MALGTIRRAITAGSSLEFGSGLGPGPAYHVSSSALVLVSCNLILYVLSIQPLRCYHFDSSVSQVSIKTLKSLTNDEHKNGKHLAKRYKTDNKHCTKNVEMFDKRSLQIAIWSG